MTHGLRLFHSFSYSLHKIQNNTKVKRGGRVALLQNYVLPPMGEIRNPWKEKPSIHYRQPVPFIPSVPVWHPTRTRPPVLATKAYSWKPEVEVITSAKGDMFSSLFVRLSVCQQLSQILANGFALNFQGRFASEQRLNFGGDPDHGSGYRMRIYRYLISWWVLVFNSFTARLSSKFLGKTIVRCTTTR